MQKLERLMDRADPSIWKVMDRGTYAAWVYGRASLAAERAGLRAEAEDYHKKAVRTYQRHKSWNYLYQEMLPATPSPEYDEAERELFAGINSMDEVIRKEGWDQTKANKSPEATPGRRPPPTPSPSSGAPQL